MGVGGAAVMRHFGSGRARRLRLLMGAAAIALSAVEAHAQAVPVDDEAANAAAGAPVTETGSGNATTLDTITVVSRTGETAIESLSSSSTISGEQLQRRMATTTNDLFFGVPGTTIQSDAKRAGASINLRGLQDYGRVAVIVDGARQNFQREGHGSKSLLFLDPDLVKQVEVVRGPVANTYGSGAIGGVVLFETKDAADFLRSDETWALSTTGRFETNGSGWTTSTTGAYRFSDSFDVLGNFVWRDFGDYRDGDGDRVAGTGFDVLSGLAKVTLRPTEFSELKLGWIGADNSWTEGGNRYDADLRQDTFTARYNVTDPDRSWLDLHVNLSGNFAGLEQTYLVDARQFDPVTGLPVIVPAGARTTYDLDTYGIDLWNTSRFETGAVSHELTYGGDWVLDDVVTRNAAGGADVYTPSGERTVGGAYIQDKITWEWLEVIGALRYDTYSLDSATAKSDGDRLSPRITVGVSPFSGAAFEGLQFYGTYAEGYRSPSINETLISGIHPNGVAFPFLPNPDLLPETAKTWEAGVNYRIDDPFLGGDSLRLKAAYFNNDIDDYIGGVNLSPFVPGSGCPFFPGGIPICFQYQNLAKAKIDGFEFESFYDAGRAFGGISASIVDGYGIENGVRTDLLTIPSTQVTAQLGFRFLENRLVLGGEVQHNWAPDGNPIAEDYTLVNLFASYEATDSFRFDLRVDNLLDEKYANPLNATTTTTVFEPGVNVKLAATMRFGG